MQQYRAMDTCNQHVVLWAYIQLTLQFQLTCKDSLPLITYTDNHMPPMKIDCSLQQNRSIDFKQIASMLTKPSDTRHH